MLDEFIYGVFALFSAVAFVVAVILIAQGLAS